MSEWDYDLKAFNFLDERGRHAKIVPGDLNDMANCISALNAGENPRGWENGNGMTLQQMLDERIEI